MDIDISELKFNNNKLNTYVDILKYENIKLNNKLNELENKYKYMQRDYIVLIDMLKSYNLLKIND